MKTSCHLSFDKSKNNYVIILLYKRFMCTSIGKWLFVTSKPLITGLLYYVVLQKPNILSLCAYKTIKLLFYIIKPFYVLIFYIFFCSPYFLDAPYSKWTIYVNYGIIYFNEVEHL